MTREEWKERLPLIQAFVEGKEVQVFLEGKWMDLSFPNFDRSPRDYRIASAPKLRPWKPEDVPVGAVIRNTFKNQACRGLILGLNSLGYIACANAAYIEHYDCFSAFERWEWKWPQEPETAWRPCGVEEQL